MQLRYKGFHRRIHRPGGRRAEGDFVPDQQERAHIEAEGRARRQLGIDVMAAVQREGLKNIDRGFQLFEIALHVEAHIGNQGVEPDFPLVVTPEKLQ